MFKKSSFLMSFALLVCIAASASAGTTLWDGDSSDPNWNVAINWSNDTLPSSYDLVHINAPNSVVIKDGTAATGGYKMVLGRDGGNATSTLTMTGGTLSMATYWPLLIIGGRNTDEAIFNLQGGSVMLTADGNSTSTVVCGGQSKGVLNMTGGTLGCGDNLTVGRFYDGGYPDSNGTINLDGGIITTGELTMIGSGLVDIGAGMLVIDGNCIDTISGYDANDWIIADDSNGNLVVDYNTINPGKTTVTATSNDANWPSLTIYVEPNNVGIDPNSIIPPVIGSPIYYWSNKSISIGAKASTDCPDVYRFNYWDLGAVNDPNSSTTILMDSNKTITAVFFQDTRRCGDECHPIHPPDLNSDCRINMVDFALFAGDWLRCTHPDCD